MDGEENIAVLSVQITPHEVDLDPSVMVFNVILENKGDGVRGVWSETWGTKGELHAFLRGVRAGCNMAGGHLQEPQIPWEAHQT